MHRHTQPLLTTADLAGMFQVTVGTIRRWRSLGKFQAIRVGRGFRFLPNDVQQLLKSEAGRSDGFASSPAGHSIEDRRNVGHVPPARQIKAGGLEILS